MNNKKQERVSGMRGLNSLMAIALAVTVFSCHKPINEEDLRDFKQVNLVANKDKYHAVTKDVTLLNAFGLAWSPTGTAWVNSVGGHVSELYSGEGAIIRDGIKIPSPTDSTGGLPTGVVFSGGKGFKLSNGPAVFLFSGFDGVVSGWNPGLGGKAEKLRNPPNARYAGLTIAANGGRNFVYGANFAGSKIDVWDTAFTKINMSFTDPGLPVGYSPYNIQAVGDYLFVMYAELGGNQLPVPGQGSGIVSVFNTDGSFVKRFASRGTLNVPWGVTMAPASFLEDQDMDRGVGLVDEKGNNDYGSGHHDPKDPVILVGNFGDGRINVYSLEGRYFGQLKSHSHPIVIDGLWALSFAPSTSGISQSRLYFTAGPDHEADGLFGYLIKQ